VKRYDVYLARLGPVKGNEPVNTDQNESWVRARIPWKA